MTSSAGTTMRSELPDMMALPSLALSLISVGRGEHGACRFCAFLVHQGLGRECRGTWRTVLHPCNSRPANQGSEACWGRAWSCFSAETAFRGAVAKRSAPRPGPRWRCIGGVTGPAVSRPGAALHCGESLAPALGPVAGDGAVGLPMPLQPGLAFAVEGLALRQFRLAALAVGAPGRPPARQQVRVVAPPQQGRVRASRAGAENPAPEDVAQQVGIEGSAAPAAPARAASSQASCPRAMAGMSA